MAEIGQETVKLSTVVSRTAEEAYVSLRELVEKCREPELSDSDKKISILKYVVKTQQRMLRLNVLTKWCQQVPLIQYSQQLASTLSSHDTCFTQTADSLFFMHEGLQQARAPIYDVPAATDILLAGGYQRLPSCVEDVGIRSTLTEDQQKPTLKKLETLVRSKLLEVSLPKEISEVKVSDGTALLRVDGEFKVLVTLGYRGHLSLWRILHLELLVGERSGPVKLEEVRRHILGDDLERRMAAADNPFVTLYSVLHELCIVLTMDTVIRQVQALRQGRWKDAIRFELMSDGNLGQGGNAVSSQVSQDGETETVLRTPGLKLLYWLDYDKSPGASDGGSCPFIKIEPGPDLQIKCLHSSFVVDPLMDKEAELSLDQSCIDVEKLLLEAICCNRYTRLLEIYKELGRNGHICRAADDVLLCTQEDTEDDTDDSYKKRDDNSSAKGKEVLRVRAYGSSYFTLGINIRNGRFLLHSSKNILESSTLLECEEALNNGSMSAAAVFVSLKTKSVLHLFARLGRFLGLQVYEHGFSAAKLPKNILSGSTMLVMGFPECGSSYFLLMQLDEDFKPIFKLLETLQDPSGKPQTSVDLNHVTRVKNIDIDMMHLLEDELNLSLLDSLPLNNDMGADQNPEIGLLSELSNRASNFNSVLPSSFSSVVDEVFELERGSSALHSVQSPSSMFTSSPASHSGPLARNLYGMRAGTSPKWDVGSQINNFTKVANINTNYNTSPYMTRLSQSSSSSLLSSGPGKSMPAKKLSASKSDQDIPSLRSPYSAEVGLYTTADEDHLVSRLSQQPDLQVSTSAKVIASTNSLPIGTAAGSLYVSRSKSMAEGPDSAIILRQEKGSGKRKLSDMLNLMPSLCLLEVKERSFKRKKLTESSLIQHSSSQMVTKAISKTDGYSYARLIDEANKGNAASNIYVSALLHVVSHCSLCIKHARLTSQMEALDIPYVEEVGLRNVSSNLWFRLPSSRGDTWKNICLRLGRPGSMYWDVKISDKHFRDLWDLQKGSNDTSWGSGIRIANASDVDSHIRYDVEGVILSYNSVEADSIKKLVADIQRLSNARMFALGMQKLLGVSSEERFEDSSTFYDGKVSAGVKGVGEGNDKSSEQMKRAFRIEAVGLMSLWFSFGSGVLARFVVEWESGKEGCTMHVSPDQLWPHTKFLEDFINGAEVASLLDCIRLTAGPLHALAAATRPARAAPVSGLPGITALNPTVAKQSGYIPSQGPTNSGTNTGQLSSGLGGITGASTNTGTPSTHNPQTAAMLAAVAAAGRSGPGIVPSSLLPIDVSVVLRGPYWIRIIYRKNFAVDMRCFAGDQVWLQPATPPKGGPTAGGSLPCPQFRPFIMEHVAQELNGFDPHLTGVQQAVGLGNSNAASLGTGPGSVAQLSANSGNRLGIPSSAGISRLGNQINGLGRAGNSLPASSPSALSSGLPLRRSPGASVPAHVRGELNTAIIGLGDDGGYGGGWVPLVALKKVLRGILKYLGVLWLFAQLPDLLKEILGSILKDNEGALLNLDQEQPALRFFVGGYVFAVSVHRVQLLLQVLSVKRFHHSQQQQQNPAVAQEELTQAEIGEICDYFSRRVASEPYDASRVASFITLLTLPISVLREFLKLIAWKKGLAQAQSGDAAPSQKSRIELCLENHSGINIHGNPEHVSSSKSNIHYDRPHNSVDFGLTVVLDAAHMPHINAAGGAAWLPYCVSVRLRYSFGEKPNVSFIGMEGSHGGRACWQRLDDWDKCKQRVIRTVEMNGNSTGELNQGRLKIIADSVQRTLHVSLQGLKDASAVPGSTRQAAVMMNDGFQI
ncbi:mediator of RNA polymerase II transcription subunit 14-like isoform X2 [Daucus carota subsp. sativus]|uniref:mediator of RNA polymerase II transcription subunit 14-like isoform X2 n=1 Tax=Daucus carota subsp. sativus TaxID=79200 RepID=UPI0007EF0E7A|nr:PREDICTED: mediator of RNA polymerase II transcription subunit 14-like [Daucus carota subsp. sativus]